jgi:hypothetical protein
MKDEELYEWARTRARQLRGLYLHVGVYLVVMLTLLMINAMTRGDAGMYRMAGRQYHRDGGDWWVVWPALAWGAAVAIHAVVVLLGGTGKVDTWEERKVEELVRREKERSGR